ncbi:MAG: hypothetical protein ABFS34_05595 [Gemmatimonadota bacterium]
MGRRVDAVGFTAAERAALAKTLHAGDVPACPRCGDKVALSRVQRPPEVAYVRSRVLAVCPSCKLSAAVDVRDPPTAGGPP